MDDYAGPGVPTFGPPLKVQLTMSIEEARAACAWLAVAAAEEAILEPWQANMLAALTAALPPMEAPIG